MSDTSFGSSLDFGMGPGVTPSGLPADAPSGGGGGGAANLPAADNSGSGPDATPTSDAGPSFNFGSALKNILPGPHYTQDANADPLDQSADLLQQRIQRAGQVAANPLLQFFNPQGVQAARAAIPQMTEQLQQIRQQRAQQINNQKIGANYGVNNIPAGASGEEATQFITAELQSRYLAGDPTAATGLAQLGRQDLVQAGGDQALSAAAANNQRYRDVVGKLNNMQNPGQYQAAYNELVQQVKDGTHSQAELNMVPKTYEEFQAKKLQINNALSVQQLQLQSLQARMQQLGGVVPITPQTDSAGNPTGLHAAIASQVRDDNGNVMGGVEPVTVGGVYNGNRLPVGSDNIGDAGVKWGLMTTKDIKDANDRLEPHKATIERAAGINKLNDISSSGDFGTNAWLLGHGIDQFVEISRNGVGGKGSATPGTIQIMKDLRGQLQTTSDTAAKEWGRVVEWYDGGKKGPQPYMSNETISQLKTAIGTLKQGSDKEIAGSVGGVAQYVGRHGGKLTDLGFEPGVSDALKPYWQQGNDAFKSDIASRPSVVAGGQRIVFDREGVMPPNAKVVGGFQPGIPPASGLPASSTAPRWGAVPPVTSSAPSGQNGPVMTPSGGGTAYSVAGQTVNMSLPAGASPNYAAATQRIETGGSRAPWSAGTKGTSASGAFQFINQTWKDNRPAGAPDRAGDATPAQQAEAFANLTNKNASALTAARIPVNDTSLYAAHNLGAGGAIALMQANPSADARTVVGEAAARNNPLFFIGRPTVATVLARYNREITKGGGADILQNGGQMTAATAAPRAGEPGAPSVPISGSQISDGKTYPLPVGYKMNPGTGANEGYQQEEAAKGGDIVQRSIAAAPAIGGIVGALAGGPVGGAVGGAGGQAVQNYFNGEDIVQPNLVSSGALGMAGGIATPGLAGMALRTGVAAAGGGAAGAMDSGASGALRGAVDTGAGAVLGEGGASAAGALLDRFGGFLGMSGHQTYSRLTSKAQQDYLDAANIVAKGEPEKPTAPAGGTVGPAVQKAYEDQKDAYDDAVQHLKTVLPHVKPEEAAYAATQVGSTPSTTGQAVTQRPVAAEKSDVVAGYNQLRSEVNQRGQDLGITSVKARPVLPDGPMSLVRDTNNPTGKVVEKYAPEMQAAEMLATAPAASAGERWQNIIKARSELLEQERTSLGGASPDPARAKAMRAGADALYPELQRTATNLFGDGAPQVMQRLDALDARYARVMNLSKDGDLAGTIAAGGDKGRQAQQAYNALSANDPEAQQMMKALVKLKQGHSLQEVGLMVPVIAGEIGLGLPTHGAVGSVAAIYKLTQLANQYMVRRGAGQPVTMRQLLDKNRTAANSNVAARAAAVAGGAAAQQ